MILVRTNFLSTFTFIPKTSVYHQGENMKKSMKDRNHLIDVVLKNLIKRGDKDE